MQQKTQPLALLTDFECANAILKERTCPACFHLTTHSDGALNNTQFAEADYYCAVRLRNPNLVAVQAKITIEVRSLPDEGQSLAVRRRPGGADPGVAAWQPFPRESTEVDSAAGTTQFHVPVLPNESLDVSTMAWLSASEVYANLRTLGKRHPELVVRKIGETPGGRWIPAVEMVDGASQDKPLLCVGATNQSHELGTIATLFLIQEVLEGSLKELTKCFRLIFLPLTNPDGNALGTCMTNAHRQNLQFGYGEDDATTPPECAAVWQYLESLEPALFLEFHSYPHLDRPSFRPYVWDLDLYADKKNRSIAKRFYALLDSVSPPPPLTIRAGTESEKGLRSSLVSRLIRCRGIPATLYKLHNRETVAVNCAQAALLLSKLASDMNWK
jgi:hypothetical protein